MASALAGPVTTFVRVTPVVSASPDYGVDDCLGSVMTIPLAFRADGAGGLLQSVIMTCLVDIPSGVTVDVLVFDQSPVNSTFTDNSALSVNVADLPFLIGVAQLSTRVDLGTPAMLQAINVALPVENAARAKALYAVAVVRGAATLNLASVADIVFGFGFLPD